MRVDLSISQRWKDLAGGVTDKRRRKAWRAGLRDAGRGMRTQATRYVRSQRAIKAGTVRKGLRLRPGEYGVDLVASGAPIPLREYPHRQVAKGVRAQIKKGAPVIIPGAFVARMRTGYLGVFRRLGKARLPIKQLYGSTVADVVQDTGVPDRLLSDAYAKFFQTYERVLALRETP